MTENQHIYLLKDERPLKIRIFGGLLLILAIAKIYSNPILGSILTFLSGGMLFYVTGKEFDLKNKKLRDLIIFGPQKFGKWSDLPEISYVSVFKLNETHGISGRSGATLTDTEQVYVTNLIHSKNKRIRVFKSLDKQKAFEIADQFAKGLSLKVWDATEGKGDWKV